MPGPAEKFAETITVKVESQLYKRIVKLAVYEKRSISQMARILLEEALTAREGSR